jgi:hypothetical protein
MMQSRPVSQRVHARLFGRLIGISGGFGLVVGGLVGCINDVNSLQDVLSPKSPAQAAMEAMDPHDPDKRRMGTLDLANAPFGGSDLYVKLYRERVRTEQDPIVLAVAIKALARHGSSEDALLIAPYLQSDQLHVRWEAAKGLQRLHNESVVGPLLVTLNNEDESQSDVRTEAALALGQYPQARVFHGLVRALDAPELAVNLAAIKSLGSITGQDFGMDSSVWLSWYETVDSQAGKDPFENRVDYLYPTYTRDDSFLETLAFWYSRYEEKPASPAGLKPSSTRSTYEQQEQGQDRDADDASSK